MRTDIYNDIVDKDWVVDGYDLKLTSTDAEFVSQKIEERLRFFKGEWYLNESLGIPYYESVLVKAPDIPFLNSIFRSAILDIEEIDEVISFSMDIDGAQRTLKINFKVKVKSAIIGGEVVV